jgi:glutaredoxin
VKARAWIAAIGLALAAAGCTSKAEDDGTTPIAAERALPSLTIRDDTPDLMLTYLDDKGDTHVALHPPEVPPSARALVRVVVSTREDGTRDLFYVTDLNQKSGDGSYAARTMHRRAWEAEIGKRRDAYLAKVAPPPAPSGSSGPSPGSASKSAVTVVIYGASWCKPCHQAADYLKAKGVRVVMKDIEESQAAHGEMREKLERTGQRGGSIPILDIGGQILVGFSPRSVDRALAKANGTVL